MATQTHTLTTDQLRMLVDAMGGVVSGQLMGIAQAFAVDSGIAHAWGSLASNASAIHTLTTSQLSKLVGLTGGGNDWPKHTGDPMVNFAVDCVVEHDAGEEESVYDPALVCC